jgi:putative sigma-54 modulation protein
MNINFEYHGVKASNRLEILTANRLRKLFDKYQFIVRADVFFKTENTSEPTTGMICGLRLSSPGPRLYSESSKSTFEMAIAEATNELERQLLKKKGKMKSF